MEGDVVIAFPSLFLNLSNYKFKMDLKLIKETLEQPYLSEEDKVKIILTIIARDQNSLPYLLTILTTERTINRDIISDLNLEVSRYHIHTQNSKLLKQNKEFLNKETKTLYEKWKDFIQPLFNNKF